MPNYQKLKTMVNRSTDQKLRLQNFDARHGKIETGAVVKSGKELSGVAGGKGTYYQWKEKRQRSKGNQSIFRHPRSRTKTSAITNRPGVKTCRVAETCAPQLPLFEELLKVRQTWTMETGRVCHSVFSLHILGGGWTKAHDPKGREYDSYMGKARTKNAVEFSSSMAGALSQRLGFVWLRRS